MTKTEKRAYNAGQHDGSAKTADVWQRVLGPVMMEKEFTPKQVHDHILDLVTAFNTMERARDCLKHQVRAMQAHLAKECRCKTLKACLAAMDDIDCTHETHSKPFSEMKAPRKAKRKKR